MRDVNLYLMAARGTVQSADAPAAEGPRAEVLRCFDELRGPLRRYLLCSGAAPEDADDAVQETFLRLHRHLERGGDRSNLYGWVFQVARNYLRDERKSVRRRRSVALDVAMPDPSGSPENRALSGERTRRLRAAIGKLPEQQRECMLLRASGLRYREIADVLGIHTASVGAMVHRATARLSEELS